MRIATLLLLCTCLVAVPSVWGQAANEMANHGILGYLDPQTGAFRPVPPIAEASADALPAATTATGTIKLTITVTLKTTTITNVTCTAITFVQDGASSGLPRTISETNTVAATGTTTTRTCALSIPYSWSLLTQSTDQMSTSYTVTGAASSTGGLPNRTSGLNPVDTRLVPASANTVTTLTAKVTL